MIVLYNISVIQLITSITRRYHLYMRNNKKAVQLFYVTFPKKQWLYDMSIRGYADMRIILNTQIPTCHPSDPIYHLDNSSVGSLSFFSGILPEFYLVRATTFNYWHVCLLRLLITFGRKHSVTSKAPNWNEVFNEVLKGEAYWLLYFYETIEIL